MMATCTLLCGLYCYDRIKKLKDAAKVNPGLKRMDSLAYNDD
jgi:hypothetical protein